MTAYRAEVAKKEAEAKAAAQEQARIDSQKKAQEAAKKTSMNAGQMAGILGVGLTITGLVMMMSKEETTKEYGQYMMFGGMAASAAGGLLNNLGDKADKNSGNLDSLTPPTQPLQPDLRDINNNATKNPTLKISDTPKANGFVAVDPNTLREGALGKAFDDFEKATGIPRDDFANAMANGASPLDIVGDRLGMSRDELASSMAQAGEKIGASGGLSSEAIQEMANKAGLGELAANAIATGAIDFEGGGSALKSGSSGASTLAPLEMPNFGVPDPNAGKTGGSTASLDFNFERDVNPEIKRQLAAQGVVRESIFDLVGRRYRSLTPHMLGYGPSKALENAQGGVN